jgi:hypothetical protein
MLVTLLRSIITSIIYCSIALGVLGFRYYLSVFQLLQYLRYKKKLLGIQFVLAYRTASKVISA